MNVKRWLLGLASPGGPRGRLTIFTYHRVLAAADPLLPGEPGVAEFERQVDWLRANFAVLPLAEAGERLARGALPRRAACITFDDGYANNATLALPVLAHWRLPASFFIATEFIGGGRMWNDTVIESIRRCPEGEIDLGWLGLATNTIRGVVDRRALIDCVIGRLKYLEIGERLARADEIAARIAPGPLPPLMMSVDQLRELHAAGMDVGAHTCSHPILNRVADVEAEREIRESRARLEEWLGRPPVSFAYPNGRPGRDYSPRHVAMARAAGFRVAVSTAWASARAGADLLQLPRISPDGMGSARFVARVLRTCQ